MGTGALKTVEGVADTVSDLIANPIERNVNYAYDLITKGKKVADANVKDLAKMQERDIKRNLTQEFQDATGYTDVKDKWEKGSLIKSDNVGGQIAQGVGGMVPALVMGQAIGATPELTNTANLAGKEKALAALGNVGKTYMAQLPSNLILGSSSYGSGMEEALNEGATMGQARKYGLANAAIEQGTEMLTGGVPGLGGKGGIDNYVEPLINKNTNGYLNALLKYGYKGLGEGLEEYAGTMLDPLAKKIYSDEDIDWNQVRKDARRAGLIGMGTGLILDAPSAVQDVQNVGTENKIRNAIGDAEYAEGSSQYNPDYKGWENQREENRIENEKKLEENKQRNEEVNRVQQERAQEEARKAQEQEQIKPKDKSELSTDIKSFEDIKQDYKYYKNADLDNFDTTMIDKAKQVVESNKQGKRTKQEWLDVAKNMGMQAENLDAESLKKLAFESFAYEKPNQSANLNRQGQKYVGFGIDEWVKAVYEGAGVGKNTQTQQIEQQPSIKQEQLNIIKENNPMNDEYHTGIRSENDIKTFEEAIQDDESFVWGDYSKADAERDLAKGTVTVYSSKPIEQGSFVSTSQNQAKDYAGGGKVYSQEVPINDVAWINGDEGQYAKVDNKSNILAEEKAKEPVLKVEAEKQKFKNAKEKVANGTANEKDRSFIKTATEAQRTEQLVKDMDEVAKHYEVISNEKSLKQAEAKLKNKTTLEDKSSYVNDLLSSGKRLDASDVAAAELVLKDAAAAKNAKVYNEVLENISIYATEAGQNIQALSMIKRLSPSSQLDVLEKIINREKAKGNKIYQNVEITEDMKNRIFDCYDENGNINQEQFENTMEEIKQEIADEMPATASEKIRAWRYLSMLGNPKTHVRNELANVAMSVVKLAKDTVNATGQDLFVKDKANKTATLKSSSKEVKNLADTVYKQTYTEQENSKYNEQSELENKRQVFKTKPLESVRKFNEKMLSAEDQFFKKINFKKSFANYLTAQGISTQADIENHPEIIQKAKNFAIEEANVATFNQRNKLSEFINSADTKLGTPGKVIRGAIIPFTRTPLNIAKTGIEYTPGTGLISTVNDVRNAPKNMKGTVLIDGLSKQITGSSLALLGYALAKSGIVTSNSDDDKEDYFRVDQGNKMDYSVKIGDTSYDLSWISPSSMPFFVGARMFEVLDKQEGINENLILESLASTLDPLSEMSVISSFTDVLSSYGNSSTGKIKDMAISTGQNYLSQFIPTVSGQFARLFDDTKRTTVADKNSKSKISQETYRQLAYKVPGLRNTLPASTDYYGQPKKEQENFVLRAVESFVNPANTKRDNLSKESQEILDVFEKTGNPDIIPTSAQQYITFNNQRYEMSRNEYNKYKKDFGDTFNKNIKKLFDSEDYEDATDDEKAKMIKNILDYSKDKAKDNFLTSKGVDYTTRTKTGKISYKESRKVENKVGEYGIVDYYIDKVLKERG